MLTFNELAANLAELTGCSSADAENFLRELFDLAAESIETEGMADIPCVGRFALMDGEVVFKPDSELADAINAPFADFEPIELPDDFSLEEITETVEISEPSMPLESVEEFPEQVKPTPEPDQSEESDLSEESAEPEIIETPAEEESEPQKRGYSFWWLLLTAIVFFGFGFLLGQRYQVAPQEPIEQSEVVERPVDSEIISEPEVLPEPEVSAVTVLDTISSSRFLTTMARSHYNQFEYWVYIYEANASRLGNPDRLDAGTVVVIPSADSLGLKAGDPEKINEALLKAKEIYNRFN